MKHLSILFLILIIVISGCVGQDGIISSAKDGLIITDFSFEYSPIYARDNVGLRLEVQNVGGSDAEIKKIQVYGVDFEPGESTEGEWGHKDEPIEFEGTYIGENRFLDKPDPDMNFEGGKYYHEEWRLQAPWGIKSETDYDFRVRVEYGYETTYSGTIRVIDDEYLRSLSENERQKLFDAGGIVSSELTNGPISIVPYSGRHFIVDSTNPQPRIMRFEVKNVGKGYPFIEDEGQEKNYYIRINGIIGDVITDCIEDGEAITEFKLSKGESHTLDCVFDPPGMNEFTNKIDKPFQIILEYYYYVDSRTSITVNPTYEGDINITTTTTPPPICADVPESLGCRVQAKCITDGYDCYGGEYDQECRDTYDASYCCCYAR